MGWNGSRGSTPYDSYSTVPTAAERAGDFSGATYKDGIARADFRSGDRAPVNFNGQANVIDPAIDQRVGEGAAAIYPAAEPRMPRRKIFTMSLRRQQHRRDEPAFDPQFFGTGPAARLEAAVEAGGEEAAGGGVAQNNINFGLNCSRNDPIL